MMISFLVALRSASVRRCEVGFKYKLDSWSVVELGNAAAGEVGEACNIAKKMLRFRDGVEGNKKTLDEYRKDLSDEMGDILIYLDLWAASEGIDLEKAVESEELWVCIYIYKD